MDQKLLFVFGNLETKQTKRLRQTKETTLRVGDKVTIKGKDFILTGTII